MRCRVDRIGAGAGDRGLRNSARATAAGAGALYLAFAAGVDKHVNDTSWHEVCSPGGTAQSSPEQSCGT